MHSDIQLELSLALLGGVDAIVFNHLPTINAQSTTIVGTQKKLILASDRDRQVGFEGHCEITVAARKLQIQSARRAGLVRFQLIEIGQLVPRSKIDVGLKLFGTWHDDRFTE